MDAVRTCLQTRSRRIIWPVWFFKLVTLPFYWVPSALRRRASRADSGRAVGMDRHRAHRETMLRIPLPSGLYQVITAEGPKLPNPWLVRRIAELQMAKMPRATRSLGLPLQST